MRATNSLRAAAFQTGVIVYLHLESGWLGRNILCLTRQRQNKELKGDASSPQGLKTARRFNESKWPEAELILT